MSRNICVYNEFLTAAHRARIEQTARENGFTVRFFDDVEKAKALFARYDACKERLCRFLAAGHSISQLYPAA